MTKAELVDAIAKDTRSLNVSKRAVEEIVDSAFTNIAKAVKKESRFSYPSFGTWNVRKRAARKGRNPQTGAEIRIKASKTVGFKPAPSLKASL